MRLLGLVIGGLVLGRSAVALAQGSADPAPAKAQTVTFADLVGEWAEQGTETRLTFRADSTFVGTDGTLEWSGRWRLAGDTLMLARIGNGGTGALQPEKATGLLKIEDSRLTKVPLEKGARTQIFERID